MANDRSSAFLAAWQSTDPVERDKLDGRLRDIATEDPDTGLAIMQALSVSHDLDARETAAIFVQYLFPARRKQAIELLLALLNDPAADIRRQALDTVDLLTGDPDLTPAQAAHRISQMK